MAQAESENISANVRWGIQQRMRTGTYAFRYNILGYRKGEDGEPAIVPKKRKSCGIFFIGTLREIPLTKLKRICRQGATTLKREELNGVKEIYTAF